MFIHVCLLAVALTSGESTFVDGGVVAAARTLPTWSDGDLPAIPSVERKSAQALQEECRKMVESFSTTIQQDEEILGNTPWFPLVFIHLLLGAFSDTEAGLFYVFCRFRRAYQENT